ncbi:11773_t:CDS:2 [Entrophospora sp. SA101]|nr:11773_t:CDS:2 [Entrophospora sp. SA101]
MSKKEFQQPPSPPPPNNPRQCNFWVKRKRRYCHLPKKLDNNYCGEHLQCEVKVGIKKERIPCPFDPSHTVYKIELEKHLKHKCNSRPKPTPAYFSLDINCTLPTPISPIDDNDGDKSNDDGKITLSGLSKETLNILINNVRNWYNNNDAVPKIIRTEVLDHEVLKEKKEITKNQKHVIQQASLLGHMKRLELLKANSCSIEFGCGKGELSYFKKLAIKKEADDNNNKSTFILIDRKNTRGKFDSLIRGSLDNKSIIKRIEIDIKDLDLSMLDLLNNNSGNEEEENKNSDNHNIVAYSKHLCGSATDITLKALINYLNSRIIIALCCHQLCRYHMYPYHDYLKDLGITKNDFQRICAMSSWAICGQRQKYKKDDNDCEGEKEYEDYDYESDLVKKEDNLEILGYQCKRILDAGRVKFLEANGFQAELIYYVEPSTSLENLALIAIPKKL